MGEYLKTFCFARPHVRPSKTLKELQRPVTAAPAEAMAMHADCQQCMVCLISVCQPEGFQQACACCVKTQQQKKVSCVAIIRRVGVKALTSIHLLPGG